MSSCGQEQEKGLEEQTMIDPIIRIPTPFKDERSLKRPITKVTNMEVDTTSKKAWSIQSRQRNCNFGR